MPQGASLWKKGEFNEVGISIRGDGSAVSITTRLNGHVFTPWTGTIDQLLGGAAPQGKLGFQVHAPFDNVPNQVGYGSYFRDVMISHQEYSGSGAAAGSSV